ncbi:unnamed protein product [Caenorhabditis sp. 36 PRJEB53466]|nr:unnamed protein product [Caenorhabditis sp. 36 PRJEB53466]
MQATLLIVSSLLANALIAHETSLSPVVHRFKRHCSNYGCGRSVCQECPTCCDSRPFNPVFNINFNCCSAPRPSPSCCPYVPPVTAPPPPPACCPPAPMRGPASCCPPPALSPVICCKQAPVPENPCCQAIADVMPPAPSSPSCCAAAPVPANPCCQPAPKPVPCTCAAPRPVPCRCAAPTFNIDCPNCDMPSARCPMSPMECSMRRMRRDVHQQILQHFHVSL